MFDLSDNHMSWPVPTRCSTQLSKNLVGTGKVAKHILGFGVKGSLLIRPLIPPDIEIEIPEIFNKNKSDKLHN